MTEKISVTEVRNALRCPRIFALGRLKRRAVAFPVGSSLLGATFHRIVERFHRAVHAQSPVLASLAPGAPRDEVESALARSLLHLAIDEVGSDPAYASMPAEVDDLAEALRELARHLAGRLARFDEAPALALEKLLRAGERAIEARLDTRGPLLHGRFDALFGDPEGGLEVIEYKLTDEANDALDRAQVALYREILRVSEGVSARPTVLRFTPILRETSTPPDVADAWVDKTLRPLLDDMVRWANAPEHAPPTARRDLCPACPMGQECAELYPERLAFRDEPPMAAARPRPTDGETFSPATALPGTPANDPDTKGRREAEALVARILHELERQGVAARCLGGPIVGPTLYVIEVSRARGAVKDLDRAAEDVVHRLAAEDGIDAEYGREGGHRRFIVRRSEPRLVNLRSLLDPKRAWLSARSGRFLVGQAPSGEVVTGDLADPSTPHLLIAGQSGSGKSVLIQSIVASLVHHHGPEAIRFTLVDPKRVTFIGAGFQAAIAAHLDGPVRYDIEDTLSILEQLVDIMEERYRIFEAAKVTDLGEYNEQAEPHARIERRVLVIDEFQDLVAEKTTKEAFFAGIKRLGAKARAAGVHMILATQRPDAATVPGLIKANLGGKIALRVASATNSRIVLDQPGAERLLGKGDLLADLGRGIVRAQAPLLQNV